MNIKALIFAATFAVPLQQMNDWQLLQYNGIAPNQVSFTQAGMTVEVMGSASPIIYPLDEARLVRRIEVTGTLNELLTLDGAKQGLQNNDDFSLKIGLVVAGDKTLNSVQKLFTADWIKRLYELAPEGSGIDSIYFLNAVQAGTRLGQQRQHPMSDLIFENNVWLLDKPGDFAMAHILDRPRKVIAIWLSIDGDDSRSNYSTLIKSLHLES
jgi:hypothetical protein